MPFDKRGAENYRPWAGGIEFSVFWRPPGSASWRVLPEIKPTLTEAQEYADAILDPQDSYKILGMATCQVFLREVIR